MSERLEILPNRRPFPELLLCRPCGKPTRHTVCFKPTQEAYEANSNVSITLDPDGGYPQIIWSPVEHAGTVICDVCGHNSLEKFNRLGRVIEGKIDE